MNTANGLQRGKDILSKIVDQVNLDGKDPRSSGAFRIIQQHALDHPSMEFSDDESLQNALAGSFNSSEDFRRMGRWTEGVCKNTKYDRALLRNVPQNDSTVREYHAEFTKIPLCNEHLTSTDMSSLGVAGTSRAQLDAVASGASNAAAGYATKPSTNSTPMRAETSRTPAAIIRQKQMLNFGQWASDAQRAMPTISNPIVLSDDDDDQENQNFLTFAQPKSDVIKKTVNVFAPATFSTPTQGKRMRTSHLLTNSAVVGPSISPVLSNEETPATASVPTQDVQTTNHLPSQPLSSIPPQVAPKSTTKQSRIPQWARESARKTKGLSTANAIRPSSLEDATPKSSLASAAKVMSDVNPTPKPKPTTESVDKAPAPTVTFNVVVNNTPIASQAPQDAQASQTPQPNQVQTNAIPLNSNRVSSTITSNKSATNEPSNEMLLTDDDDDTETDAAKQPQMWKTVANRHPTPGIQITANRRSGNPESNKSLRRQLFRPINDNNDQMHSLEPEQMEDDAVEGAGGECVVITVSSQTGPCAPARNLYETHSVVTEQSVTDGPISQTYDKENAALRNFTYDVVNPTGGTQPTQNTSEQNARTTEAAEPEPSGMPSDAVLDSIDGDSAHGAVAMDGADSGSDSSVGSSSTLQNSENSSKIVSVQSPHANHEKTKRNVSVSMTSTNSHSVRLPSLNIATSTTNPIRESETFTGLLPPTHFQDDPIITEHSPTIVRESIKQIISSQKNKSPIPLSLPNRSRQRRKNKAKPSEANRFDNLTDDIEPTLVGGNGRRTLYTKGNSDCEDNDAVSNAAGSINAQPSTSNAVQRESNMTDPQNPQIAANSSKSTCKNPNENISFENNSVLANSTMRTATEPAMTTMADGRSNHLSDVIEEVPVTISTEQVTDAREEVGPKRSQKATKSNARTKRAQRGRSVKETAVNASNDTAETTGVRRSKRPKTVSLWATKGPLSVYDLACQKASTKRRPSPARTIGLQPEPDGESRATTSKKRRIADKTNQTTKARADATVAVGSKSKNKKEQEKQTPATEPTTLHDKNFLCQRAKDLGWFNDLCSTKPLPTLVSQEGLYKIHMNQLGTVKIESTNYGQIHYFSNGKIDYGYFPGVIRTVGIMRFYQGGSKGTSQTETAMELQILHGTFEVWQGKKSIKVGKGVIFIQPGTTYRLKYLDSSVGVVYFHLFEKE